MLAFLSLFKGIALLDHVEIQVDEEAVGGGGQGEDEPRHLGVGVVEVDDGGVVDFKRVFQLLREVFLSGLLGLHLLQQFLLAAARGLELGDPFLVFRSVLDAARLDLFDQFVEV